jgi:hypothetical protein
MLQEIREITPQECYDISGKLPIQEHDIHSG